MYLNRTLTFTHELGQQLAQINRPPKSPSLHNKHGTNTVQQSRIRSNTSQAGRQTANPYPKLSPTATNKLETEFNLHRNKRTQIHTYFRRNNTTVVIESASGRTRGQVVNVPEGSQYRCTLDMHQNAFAKQTCDQDGYMGATTVASEMGLIESVYYKQRMESYWYYRFNRLLATVGENFTSEDTQIVRGRVLMPMFRRRRFRSERIKMSFDVLRSKRLGLTG